MLMCLTIATTIACLDNQPASHSRRNLGHAGAPGAHRPRRTASAMDSAFSSRALSCRRKSAPNSRISSVAMMPSRCCSNNSWSRRLCHGDICMCARRKTSALDKSCTGQMGAPVASRRSKGALDRYGAVAETHHGRRWPVLRPGAKKADPVRTFSALS